MEVKEHKNIVHCYSREHISISDRQSTILKGKLWKNATVEQPNPLKSANKNEIKRELEIRNKSTNTLGQTKAYLMQHLKEELHGQQHLPDFLFHTPPSDLSSFNLDCWEIPEFEFMHDFTNFFSNLIEELPLHITDASAKKQIDKLFKTEKGDH